MKYEVKLIYLDENLKIVDGNKEYFIYFERIGHRFSTIDEIVLPGEKPAFLNFLDQENTENKYEVFHFLKYSGEYRLNRVSLKREIRNGKKMLCLQLVDIEDAFLFFEKSIIEEDKQRYVLSIMEDSFFSYEKKTNLIKIIHYYDGKCYVDVKQDIDSWKKTVIEDKNIPEDQIPPFEKLVTDIKACPSKIFSNIKCSIRTNGKIMQSTNFFGVRHVTNDEEISIVGRILPDEKEHNSQQTQNTNELISELQFDSLTKCFNKKTIVDKANKLIKEARKTERFAFVILDLDNFKPVNDAYGHLAGDRVLEQTGEVLRSIVGDKGLVGRYGGDEFLLILYNMDNEEILRGTLQAMLNNIRTKFENAFDEIKVTPSIGAAVYPDDGDTFDELFRKCDFCLYRAKDKGRNRYIFFRPDLHMELYKKSTESTTGVKYQGREIQELKYMAGFMNTLSTKPYSAINNVCQHMVETYALSDLSIYYGKDLKRIFLTGQENEANKDVYYVREKCFEDVLEGKNYIRIDFPEDVSKKSAEFAEILAARGIKSTIQCILGTPDDIKGLITFNKTKEAQQWAEYEVNCAVMFASCFNLLPESTKIDFALYNKI